MISAKDVERMMCETFNLDLSDAAREMVDQLIEWTDADTSFIIDTVIEAGKEMLPPGITNQMWEGFVLGYFTHSNSEEE